jgi:hypothetical protein
VAKNWKHPKLGQFTAHKSGHWSRQMNVPAFAAFSYDTGYSNAHRSTGDITFTFSPWLANDHLDAPTPGMIAVAEKILDDPKKTVQMVAEALWQDFNGRGPDSGMWWHGEMDEIFPTFEELKLPPPTRGEDVLNLLNPDGIDVFDRSWDLPDPVAYLQFHAAFEQEHGLTLLSNGDAILGIGYAGGEVSPWKTKDDKPPTKPKNPFK